MQSRQEREEEEELQAALLASLEDEYMPGNEKISSNKHSTDSELYSEEDMKNLKLITKSLLFTLIPLHNNEKCIKYYNLSCDIII